MIQIEIRNFPLPLWYEIFFLIPLLLRETNTHDATSRPIGGFPFCSVRHNVGAFISTIYKLNDLFLERYVKGAKCFNQVAIILKTSSGCNRNFRVTVGCIWLRANVGICTIFLLPLSKLGLTIVLWTDIKKCKVQSELTKVHSLIFPMYKNSKCFVGYAVLCWTLWQATWSILPRNHLRCAPERLCDHSW